MNLFAFSNLSVFELYVEYCRLQFLLMGLPVFALINAFHIIILFLFVLPVDV